MSWLVNAIESVPPAMKQLRACRRIERTRNEKRATPNRWRNEMIRRFNGFGRAMGLSCSLAAASLLLASSVASAGIDPPVLEMDIQIFSKADTSTPIFDQTVIPSKSGPFGEPNSWSFNVGIFDPAFNIEGEINASPTTSPSKAFINPTLNFNNFSADSLWFMISLKMPVAHTFDAPLEWFTSASWTLAGQFPPQLQTLEDTPLWSVGTDGTEVASLFPDPTVMDINQLNLSDSTSGDLFSPVLDYMTIDLAFKLDPGSVAGVNGIFEIIPAPGALAVFGLAGLMGRSRRRR